MSDMPVPENTTVLIPTAATDRLGNPIRRATEHRYSHTEEVDIAQGFDEPDIGYAHVFRCTETGALRRYGFEGSPSPNVNIEEN